MRAVIERTKHCAAAAASIALAALIASVAAPAAPTAAADPAYPAGIVAREACPARDPDYADYRARQMANYRQEAAAAQAQGLVMRSPVEAEASIIDADEYAARGAPGVSCERITYLSDGLRVIGYLWRPTGARPGDRLPLLVFHRGGTGDDSKLRPNTQFAFDRFVRAGYVVIGTQYRGNDGGEGRDEVGGADLRDVLEIVRIGRQLPWVDPERVFALGYSRGGMMALMAARAGAPYRAIATVGAPTDLAAARAAGGRGALADLARRAPEGADPEAALEARSALRWAGEITVPVLLMHGGADPIVSAAQQARPFAARLAALGKVHELVVFDGDTHGLQMSGRERDTRILEWFRRFDLPARWRSRGPASAAERAAAAAVQRGLDLGHDGERDVLGRAAAEVEPHGRAQPRPQRGGARTEFRDQPFTPGRGSEQPHIGHAALRQRGEMAAIGDEVMAHHHRRVEAVEVEGGARVLEVDLSHAHGAGEARRVDVGRSMVDQRDLPAEQRRDALHGFGIGARPADEQRRHTDGDEREDAVLQRGGPAGEPVARCGGETDIVHGARQHGGPGRTDGEHAAPVGDVERERRRLAPLFRCEESAQGVAAAAGVEPPQQDAHQAFATEAEPPNGVVGAAAVVAALDDGIAAGEQFFGALLEVALEAAAAQQAGAAAARREQHQRAGFAVGRAAGLDDERRDDRVARRRSAPEGCPDHGETTAACQSGVPSSRLTAMTAERGRESPPSGQRLAGLAMLPPSPGCWMLRNSVRPSGVNSQPQTSAPTGALIT